MMKYETVDYRVKMSEEEYMAFLDKCIQGQLKMLASGRLGWTDQKIEEARQELIDPKYRQEQLRIWRIHKKEYEEHKKYWSDAEYQKRKHKPYYGILERWHWD